MTEYLLLINSVLIIGLGVFIYRENKGMKMYISRILSNMTSSIDDNTKEINALKNRIKKPLVQVRKV